MNLTELSVRRPVTGVMVFLVLTLLGVFTFARLKLDLLPNLEFPLVVVITQFPGAGPESIEQLVTRPIENAMASVENVEELNSTSNQDVSVVSVKFAWGTDMQQAEQDVRKNLEIYALDALPDDVPRPLSFALDPAMQPVVFLAVNAPGGPAMVRRLAEDEIEPYLARIPGVAAAEVIGGVEREIQVRLKPEWLEAYRIPAPQVIGALRGASAIIPSGRLDQGAQELNISTGSEFRSVDQIREVVVGQTGGVAVRLADVAEVADTYEEQLSVVRSNDQSAVMIAVRKQSDANTVQVATRVLAELDNIERRLPEGASLTQVFDQALPINRALSNLSSSAFLAVLLTALVLLVFLRSWRTSAIVLVSIPLSLLVTFAVMDAMDVTLNIISMAGLALAVGMLVDNSIVVLENIFSRLSRGEPLTQACIDGTREMAMPITASTLTTVVVFAPVLFVPGMAGQLFRDMCLTICISLIISLLVALTLVPLMGNLMISDLKMNRFERLVSRLTAWIDPLAEFYGRLVGVCLANRKKILAGTALLFVGSLALSTRLGVDFMGKNDQGHLTFNVKAAPGTSLEVTDGLFKEIEAIIKTEVPEAEMVVSQFGGGEGFAALFGQSSYAGNVQIRLPARVDRARSQFEIEDLLRKRFEGLAGVEALPQSNNMMGAAGDVVVKIIGDDLEALREYGQKMKTRLSTVPGAKDLIFSMELGKPQLFIDLDRDQIRELGLTPTEVASTISTYFLGTTANMYREDGDEFKILVRAPLELRQDVNRLRSLPIMTPRGLSVPLETVADVRQSLGPTDIGRTNQRRMASIAISANNVPLATLIKGVEGAIAEVPPPEGISTSIEGTAEDLAESFLALGWALLAAALLVYMVMASQFESLLEPFVILTAVPLAICGALLGLLVTGTTLQVTALIGFILLAGVVVNNGIVLIDVLKNKRLAGEELVSAAIEAGRSRLRPILMTTLTTVFGMVPMAFEIGDGSELWSPMARAVIGGMILSSVLTLVVVPVLYVSLAGWHDRRKARRAAKRGLKVVSPSAGPTEASPASAAVAKV